MLFKKNRLANAYVITKSLPEDSLQSRMLSTIAYEYLRLKDSNNFRNINREAFDLAKKVRDTFTMGDTYWNYANYFKRSQVFDSAYYYYHNAELFFEAANEPYLSAKMLFGMSFIKGRFRDYYGSEALIVEAIDKFKSLEKNKSLYASYDHLSTLNLDIKNYDKALQYHKEAQTYRTKVKDNNAFYEEGALNNLGLIYSAMGAYDKAKTEFSKALESENLKQRNALLYARLLDNKSYAGLLSGDTLGVNKGFMEALHIRDSLQHKSGISVNTLHLAQYHKTALDTPKALGYALRAKQYSREVKNNRDYLTALQLLSQLDPGRSKEHLDAYIAFNDSLMDSERAIQNKFARIAFETGQYIEANRKLSRDKNNILFIGLGVLVLMSALYYANAQRTRSQKLELQTAQQQAKLEEGRIKERKRISEELHDGVLGKLFGTRVGLGFLELSGDDETIDQHNSFLGELQEIEKEIREISHDLSNNIGSSGMSFIQLIQKMLKANSKIGNYSYEIHIAEEISWDKIDQLHKVNIYRIIQEALQNTIKYAKASKVILSFSIVERQLVVTIKDDGIGFVRKKNRKGIGLKNMESRVTNLNGSFDLQSNPESGTQIALRLPL